MRHGMGSGGTVAAVCIGLAALAGCGGSSPTTISGFGDGGPLTENSSGSGSGVGTGPTTLGSGSGSAPAGPLVDGGSLSTGDASADCPASARLIYVTGVGSKLYSFNPETATFTLVGTLTCLASPTHMTVDRSGTAWVVSSGRIYKASTLDASCSAVSNWTPDPVNFGDFALTFLGTTSATDSTLYILGNPGELGSFDTLTGHVTSIGHLSIQASGDMTTNGDGTLYFLEQAVMQTLNQINPTNAAVLASYQTGQSLNSQALAYYGGLFYDFVGSSVFTFDTTTKVATSLGTAPLSVTGAGQSTCVPQTAPPPAPIH